MFKIKIAKFFRCVGLKKDLEDLKVPFSVKSQGAIVGRSNVGKSSLLNHLLQNKKLAKVSSTPGKTQTINYFLIDESLLLIDLPGYGFAKRSKELKTQWHELIESYFDIQRPHFILILLDLRVPPSTDDIQMIKWAAHLGIQVIFVLTKADKFAKTKVAAAEKTLLDIIEKETNLSSFSHVCYSIKQSEPRQKLLALIGQQLLPKGRSL
ncbi:MAG: ribosome biogenesis GTP-binding protein YihA/YsxC [Rhabdochlamydiaceae bacterium]|nr:ribosome biogenesis GTP-binding protein YihA/YsxC [Candidatus Amphrikana amoebophyrae]